MKTLDNTICYHELLMVYEDTGFYPEYNLPEGYHFQFYQKGDRSHWIQIHLESGEFTSVEEGERIFEDFYGHFLDKLHKRCIFIVEDKTCEKIGTSTVSLLREKEFGYEAVIDWFAIKKSHQGKHLSKALLTKMIWLAHKLNHGKLLLHTQTTTYLAAKIYLDFGFKPFNKEERIGWRILKSLINHDALQEFERIEEDKIYDKKNIAIERQLTALYKTCEFNYSILDQDGFHHVYANCFGQLYKYVYFINGDQIKLEQIKEI